MTNDLNRPVAAADLGREFDKGEAVSDTVTLKLGRGIYRKWDGTLEVYPRWWGSRGDRLLTVLVMIIVFIVGYAWAEWVEDGWSAVALVAAVAVAFALGWVLHKWW